MPVTAEAIDYEEVFIKKALQYGGKDAYGIAAIEIYMLSTETSLLVKPDNAFWCNPNFIPKDKDAYDRITKEDSSEYLEAPPQAPGVGLAGTLWVTVNTEHDATHRENTSASGKVSNRGMAWLSKSFAQPSDVSDNAEYLRGSKHSLTLSRLSTNSMSRSLRLPGRNNENTNLKWRDIHSLNSDPDQPTFLRLQVLEKAGFAKITGVRFDICGNKGIVVFFAEEDVDTCSLNLSENQTYLRNVAMMLGASATLMKSRTKRRASVKFSGKKSVKILNEEDNITKIDSEKKFFNGMKHYFRKLKGGNLQPPPPMSTMETILTFFGVLFSLVSISGLSEVIKSATDNKYSILMGPFGALMTLQYSLVMAPASQPRNALLGQTVAICIAMSFTYIPTWIMPVWFRSPLATATTIATISKLGIVHPPAAASSLIISAGNFDWMVLPLMLLGNTVAIFIATLVNNLSENRHYPTFIFLGENYIIHLYKIVSEFLSRPDDEEEDTDPEVALTTFQPRAKFEPVKFEPSQRCDTAQTDLDSRSVSSL